MALARQLIDIPFAAGLGQKDDPKQLVPPKLLELENGDFTTLKQIRKRPQLRSSGTIPTQRGVLGTEYRGECIALDGESLFSLAGSTFNSKGALPIVTATTEPGARSPAISVDSTASGDWRITVWKPAAGQALKYSIQHIPTGQVLYTGTSGLTGSIAPKVVAFGNYFVVFYAIEEGSGVTLNRKLYYQRLTVPTVSSAPVVSSPVLVFSLDDAQSGWTANDPVLYDVCVRGLQLYIAAHHTWLSVMVQYRHVNVSYLNSNFVQVDLTGPTPDWLASAHTLTGVSIFPDWNRSGATQAGVMLLYATDEGIYAQPLEYDDNYLSRYVRALSGAADARFLTGISGNFSVQQPDALLVLYATEETDGISETYFVTRYVRFVNFSKSVPATGAVSGTFAHRVRPCAKLVTYTNNLGSTGYVLPVIHESGMQPTIYALRITPNIYWTTYEKCWAARYLPSLAGGYAYNVSGIPVKWTQPYDELAESTGGKWASIRRTDSEETGVDILGFGASLETSAVEYADNLHVASGGVLWMYDGTSPVEHSFLTAPTVEERPFVGGSGAGSHIYAYRFLYAWTDARGQTHRSAPAPEPLPTDGRPGLFRVQTNDPIDSTHKVSMKIPSLVETAKSGVTIEVYRTTDASQGGGTVYYLAGTVANDADGWAVLFDDGMPDDYDGVSQDFLREQMQCYTEGGVVQNDPAPASSILCEHGNRLWTVDSQSPGVIDYSRNLIPVQAGASGIPAEFSSYFQTRVTSNGEEVTGIGSLDEKLVVFTRNNIGFIMGDGPDDTGGGGSFNFYPLPHRLGCIKHGSIVSTSKGLIFQSDQGFMLLDRSLQIVPVGIDVETFAKAADIVSGLSLTTATQVHLVDATNSRLLAYDTLTEQWSMWPLPGVPAAVFQYGTSVEILLASGVLLEQTPWTAGTYGDSGAYIPCKVGTGWVKLSGLAGYERLRRIWITGEYKSRHFLDWELYLDYSSTPAQSGSVEVTAAMPQGGGYQIRIDVVHQKCEAFRVVVADRQEREDDVGEGMRLSGLTLEVGAKKGGAKLATPQITG